MRKLKPEELKNLELTIGPNGFTIWITEVYKGEVKRHWLLDASCVKKYGTMSLPIRVGYKYHTVIKDNNIKFVKLSKSERL